MQATGADIPLHTFQGGIQNQWRLCHWNHDDIILCQPYFHSRWILCHGTTPTRLSVLRLIPVLPVMKPTYQFPIGSVPVKIMEIQAINSANLVCQPANFSFNFNSAGGAFPTAVTQWVLVLVVVLLRTSLPVVVVFTASLIKQLLHSLLLFTDWDLLIPIRRYC